MDATDRGRCPTHGLVLGPGGDCVLCRRSVAPPPSPPGCWALVAGVVVVLVASTLGVRSVVGTLRGSSAPAPPLTVEPQPRIEVSAPDLAPRARPEPPPRPRARWGAAPRPEPRAPEIAAPATPEPVAPSAPDQLALRAARRSVSITMYGADWCGSCRAARAYLHEQGIQYTDRDVDDGDRNHQRLLALNPAGTIPTFDIDERVIVGFGPQNFEAALDAAAAARVARR